MTLDPQRWWQISQIGLQLLLQTEHRVEDRTRSGTQTTQLLPGLFRIFELRGEIRFSKRLSGGTGEEREGPQGLSSSHNEIKEWHVPRHIVQKKLPKNPISIYSWKTKHWLIRYAGAWQPISTSSIHSSINQWINQSTLASREVFVEPHRAHTLYIWSGSLKFRILSVAILVFVFTFQNQRFLLDRATS